MIKNVEELNKMYYEKKIKSKTDNIPINTDIGKGNSLSPLLFKLIMGKYKYSKPNHYGRLQNVDYRI